MARAGIVQVVADGRPGGGTTAVLGLAQDLQASDAWTVTLITQARSYAAEQARALDLRVIEADFFRSRLDLRLSGMLRRRIAEIDPMIVHAHGARGALPIAMNGRADPRFVYSVHGFHFARKATVPKWLGRAAERRIARNADHVIFVSEADRTIARHERIEPVASTVIYNGIDLSAMKPTALAEKRFDLVFVARMHRQKNPLFVLDILEALPAQPNQLLMIGGGDLEGEVRAQAARRGLAWRIHFTGELSRTETLAALPTARLMLFPSLWEGLPIGPIEAMACGVPIIASDIDGTREVVTNGVTGALIASFDAAAYAEAISALLRDDARRGAMALAGERDVAMRFDRARSSAATLALYDGLLAGAARKA